MGLSLLATTDTQIIRVVEALYTQTPGYTYLTNFRTYVTENSVDDFANALAGNFSTQSDAVFAATVTANLGLTGDALVAGNAYLEGQFAAYPAARGKVVLDAMNALSTLETHEVYGTAAIAYNANVVASLTYSTVVANTTILAAGQGQTLALTSAADALVGGSKDDTFSGIFFGANATGTTVQAGDSVTGGAGTDVLTISVAGASGAAQTISALQTASLETILVSNFDTSSTAGWTHTIDGSLMSGVTTMGLSASNAYGDTLFTEVQNLVAAEMRSGSGDLTLAYATTVVAGLTDTQSLTVSGLTGGNFTAAGIETVNIATETLKSTLTTLTAAAATSLTITGDKQLTITDDIGGLITTIDASATTAGVLLVNESTTVSFTGGSGDDTYKTANAVSATYTVDAGAGTDTLSVTAATVLDTALETARYTNFEVLQIASDGATGAFSQDMSLLDSGITTVTITSVGGVAGSGNGAAATRTTALTNAAAAMTLEFESLSNVNTTTSQDVDLAISVAVASDSSADSLSVVLGTATAASGTTLAGDGTSDVELTLTASNAETISVLSQGGANFIEALDAADLTTLTLTGDKALTIEALANTTLLATIDASAMTAALVMGTNASTTASTITGTAKADTLTGGTKADTITGGAGIDTISGAAGNDVIDGGDGADIITSGTGDDTVTGGEGIDDIRFATADLTLADTVDAGAGVDLLTISNAATLVDADFTGVTNVETLEFEAATTSVVLGAEAAEAGIVTITNLDIVTSLTLGVGFTNDVSITLDTGTQADNILAALYAGALSLDAGGADTIASNDVFTGGVGTSDTLTITSSATAITAAELAGVTAFETITFKTNIANVGLTLADVNVASTKSLTIDGSTMTSSVLTVDLTAETNGAVTVIGGGAADIITGSASTLGDTLNGNAGADLIKFASANLTLLDTVDGGAGTDKLQITDAATVIDTDFTLVTNVEELTLLGAGTSVKLDTLATATGIVTVDATATGNSAITLLAGYTVNSTIKLADDADTITATAYTADLIVNVGDVDNLTSADTLIGGTGLSDTLQFTLDGSTDALVSGAAAKITNFETFTVMTDDAVTITMHDTTIASGKTLTIDGTAMLTQALTVVGTAETNGALVVLGGAGADAITGTVSSIGDNLSGNSGNDTFTFASANLTALDTIDGGAGAADVIVFSDAGVLADTDFTGITNVEQLTTDNANAGTINIVLGAQAAEAGITKINSTAFATGANTSTFTLGAAYTNNLTVALTDNTSTINGTSYTGALTVTIAEDNLISTDTIIGGTGADTLTITFGGSNLTAADMAGVTKIETIATATNAVGVLTSHNNNVASGSSLTINATKNTSATFTFDGSAELDGAFVYTGGAGVDTVTGGAKNDTIGGGAGADVITGGLGIDTLTGGAAADTFKYTAAAQSTGSTKDSITDFLTGTDKLDITLDYSSLVSAVTINTRVTTAAAGGSAAQNTLTGERGQAIYDTTNSVLYVNANNDNLLTSLDYQIGINAASTAANSVVNADMLWTISGSSAADSLTITGGAATLTNLGLGGTNDALSVAAGASVVATVAGNWAATSATVNLGSVATDFQIEVASTYTVDLTNATVGTASSDGFKVTSTGTGTVTGSAGDDNLTNTSGNASILGLAGDDTIVITAGTSSVTGGTGQDAMTAGSGTDTFIYALGDSISTAADTITGWAGGTDIIDHAANIILGGATAGASAGNASIAADGLATFDGADDTLAERIIAVEADLTGETAAEAGEAAAWTDGTDSWIFISDGSSGVQTTDLVIKIIGVVADEMQITSNVIDDLNA